MKESGSMNVKKKDLNTFFTCITLYGEENVKMCLCI